MAAGKGVLQPVAQHGIVNLRRPQAIAPAPALEQIRGAVHVLEAPGDGAVDLAADDLLRRADDSLSAGAADPVDRHGGNGNRQAAAESRLPRRILAVARLDDIAHDDAADFGGIEAELVSTARTAVAPSAAAGTDLSEPLKAPIGVRAASHSRISRKAIKPASRRSPGENVARAVLFSPRRGGRGLVQPAPIRLTQTSSTYRDAAAFPPAAARRQEQKFVVGRRSPRLRRKRVIRSGRPPLPLRT